jgi:hypothetical protein
MFRHHPDTPYSCFSNDPVVRSRIAIISIFCQEALTPTPTLLTSRAESLLTGALACGTCTYLYKVCILLHLSEPYKHDHTCLDLSTMMVRRIVYCSCMKRLKKMLSSLPLGQHPHTASGRPECSLLDSPTRTLTTVSSITATPKLKHILKPYKLSNPFPCGDQR